jgi:demethylmenaquinone methyltransferase / 2-methoxy-6-polyprenyl-1,4-benzoquinol methylase
VLLAGGAPARGACARRRGARVRLSPRLLGSSPETETEIAAAVGSGEEPAVSGKRPPWGALPQDDVREVDSLVDVGAHGKTPEHPGRVDEVGGGSDPARGAVGSDDDVGAKIGSGRKREAVESLLTPERLGRSVRERFSAGSDRGLVKRGVEIDATECNRTARIGTAGVARQPNAPRGRSDDDRVADRDRSGYSDAQVGEQLDASRAHQVATRLVAGKLGLVDERDPGAAAGEHRRCDTARRPCSDDERIEVPSLHRPSSTVRTLGFGCTPGERHGTCNSGQPAIPTALHAISSAACRTATTCWQKCSRSGRTAGGDGRWSMVDRIVPAAPARLLDVATGTAGVALRLAERTDAFVAGLDLTEAMLRRGQANIAASASNDRIELLAGRAEDLPFPDATFDGVTFTYLLRYVAEPAATLQELARVLKPGAPMASLDFLVPRRAYWRWSWWLYTRLVLPVAASVGGRNWIAVGRFLGPNISAHYRRYPLGWTVQAWRDAGMTDVAVCEMSLGGGLVMWGTKSRV